MVIVFRWAQPCLSSRRKVSSSRNNCDGSLGIMNNEDTSQAGKIEFRCTCGTLFRVDARFAGRKGRCKTCGVSLLIPAGQTDVADKDARLSSQAPARGGGEEDIDIQRLCSICQCDIEPADQIIECPECNLPYHDDCWSENFGCSTYGCLQVSILKAGPDIRVESDQTGSTNSSQREQTEEVWHCRIDVQIHGPHSALELASWAQAGRITERNYVWKAGMDGWREIRSVPALASLISSGADSGNANADIPWEFLFLAASALAFLIGLVSYGIPPLLLLFGTIAFAATKFRQNGSWVIGQRSLRWLNNRKAIAVLAISHVVSLAGFIIGLVSSLE
jgi:hypothetical protein